MMYFNIRRVACQGGSAYGVSDRIDLYVADLNTLGLPGNYVVSFELPEGYLLML